MVFEAPRPSNVHVWALGLSCEAPGEGRQKEHFWRDLPPFGACEGSGDVVGVLTLLVGGVAQAFHDDRVVELRVQLRVEEVEGKDREEQVEVEREKRVKEGAP